MNKNGEANRLIKETSPYLLQHAYNPVDWFPWGNEAFEKAKEENKPILVSIGYSTCHWCHVMERESFEDHEIAQYMNEHFINIKIDREERPDIDQIYMDAVQALTGSGGWPLNCFLTPDLKPFYGGTYFPPKPNHGRPSWQQLLKSILDTYHNKKEIIKEQTEKLLDFIENSDNHFINPLQLEGEGENVFNKQLAINIFQKLKEHFDTEFGGFGLAPKFPSSMSLKFLLDYHYLFKDEEALIHVNLSLEKMIKGGLYDQLGGGFARYSTDKKWLVPHFEKMLYDNALLVSLLSDAFAATKNELYEETIHEILDWVNREMTDEEGGFYSALDADTDGVEGKFYVWDKREIFSLLGDDAYIFNAFYDITEQGNWEGVNIPRRRITLERLAMSIGWEELELKRIMEKWKLRLFLERNKRTQPDLDDKILLDWNALMCKAYCQAYKTTGKEKYKIIAEKNISFIYNKMKNEEGFYHSYNNREAKHDAFLNDYAFLIEALIELYQITHANCYLHEAKRLTDYVFKHFYEEGCFYFTKKGQIDILARKKNLYDNAVPSGNATMVQNLQKLSIIFGEETYREIARNLLSSLTETVEKYPQSFSKWANAALYEIVGIKETAIVGKDAYSLSKSLNKEFVPNKIVMTSLKNSDTFPLLKDRAVESKTYIYLCSNFSCQYPVNTIPEYLELLNQ